MRCVSKAICTSAEPVSRSCSLKSSIVFAFASIVSSKCNPFLFHYRPVMIGGAASSVKPLFQRLYFTLFHTLVSRELVIFDVITPQAAVITEVQAAIGDYWIGPGLLHLIGVFGLAGGCEMAFLAIGLGRGLDECDLAIFAVKIKPAISVAERGCAQGMFF